MIVMSHFELPHEIVLLLIVALTIEFMGIARSWVVEPSGVVVPSKLVLAFFIEVVSIRVVEVYQI